MIAICLRRLSRQALATSLLVLLVLLVSPATSSLSAADLIGEGSTFPEPLYAKWIRSFEIKDPGIHIRYQATDSEDGIRSLRDGKVDFAGSDFPLTDAQVANNGEHYLHLPSVLGAVVPAYNIPGFLGDLRLTPEALAGIYLGKIRKWDDAVIQRTNPGIKLPGTDIVVVHRSDGSGTTFIWSDYLSKVSPQWLSTVGRGSTLHWPVGDTGAGNEGVAAQVTRTANSIGYIEFIYGVQHRLAMAAVQNSAGNFIQADIPSITTAAASASVSEDFRISITNPPDAHAYPISSFTWLVVPLRIADEKKRQALFAFLNWALSNGQRQAAALGYVSIPKYLLAKEQAALTLAQAGNAQAAR